MINVDQIDRIMSCDVCLAEEPVMFVADSNGVLIPDAAQVADFTEAHTH